MTVPLVIIAPSDIFSGFGLKWVIVIVKLVGMHVHFVLDNADVAFRQYI